MTSKWNQMLKANKKKEVKMAAETPSSIVLSCFPPVAAEPLVHSIFFAKSLIHPKWHFYALVFLIHF